MAEVIFLGSGSAVPTARKNHPGVFIRYKNENILLDCGEGIQRQFRKAHLNPCKLTRIFISHWHGDHVLGIPGLLYTLALNGYNKKLEIYGPHGTKVFVKKMMDLFISQNKIEYEAIELTGGRKIDFGEFVIETLELRHGARCLAYNFIEKDRTRIDKKKLAKLKIGNVPELKKLLLGKNIVVNGKKIKAKDLTYVEKGKKISFVLDTLYNSKISNFVKGADLLICESTYLDEEELAKEHKHMTMIQATAIAKKAHVNRLILMHLSQRYEKTEKHFLKEARKRFKNVEIANDLDKVEI